ncbi:MAG: PAS domain S-box protein [Myxococcales bacterium]|nr:PAS domain S-box protein [Myxococcales bacterium]MCB9521664.1 PAS domain S-box protein [Myxococcales bacterium]
MVATEIDGSGGLREKLEWLMLFRLVLVTFLLGSAVMVNVNDVESFSDPSYIAIVSLIVGSYAATLVYVYAMRAVRDLRRVAYAQLVGDGVLAAGLVLLTGGIHSVFTFIFFLTIFAGAVLLGRPGALFAAACSAMGLASIVLLQFGDFELVGALLPDTIPRPAEVPVYPLILNLGGFYTVAAFSGYLAEKLGQVGSELERRRLDIRELRALNENIVHSLSSGLLTLDLDGRIIYFNVAAERITGLQLEEMVMRPLGAAIPELGAIVDAAPAVADLPTRPRFEQRLVRPDGMELYLGVSVSPLQNAQGERTGYIMIFQDVTELKTMRDAVLRQEHLSAIGKLSAAIAHEVRNPLASISGSIEMLRMSLDPPEDERQLMDIVIREVDRLNALIEDFLAYARPTQSRRRDANVAELVSDTVRVYSNDPSLSPGVTVEIGASLADPAVAPSVYADPAQIQQVLWNLLRNARDAMPTGGTVTIEQRTHLDLRTGRDVVELIVADTGPGLSADVIPHLFEPFFTTKAAGSGLGLATCHRIVTAHHGQLSARTRDEGGAEFTVTLPAASREDRRSDSTTVDAVTELMDSSGVPRAASASASHRFATTRP